MKKLLIVVVIVFSVLLMWKGYFPASQQTKTQFEESKKTGDIGLQNKADGFIEPTVSQDLTEVVDSISTLPPSPKNGREPNLISSASKSLQKTDVEALNIPTPDELYAQQVNDALNQDELPPTIPSLEVIPDELSRIEEAYAENLSQYNGDMPFEEPLPDDPDQPYQPENLIELPASENYESPISIELQELEQANAVISSLQQSNDVDVLYDDPDTLEISDPLYYEPSIESESDANIE